MVVGILLEGTRVVIEHCSVPSFAVVVAIDDHAIAPAVVDDEGQTVVFGGFHPIVAVGAPVDTIFLGEEGELDILFVPSLATVGRTPVADGLVNVTFVSSELSGSHMDDVTVFARGHHCRMRVGIAADSE